MDSVESFKSLQVGDKLMCVQGWMLGDFEEGKVYTVTAPEHDGLDRCIEINGKPVHLSCYKDFELVNSFGRDDLPKVTGKNDVRVWAVVVDETGRVLNVLRTRDGAREAKQSIESEEDFFGVKLRVAKFVFDSFDK